MTHFKAYLKNIIFAVLLTAILVAIGATGVSSISDMELRKSTYTRTEFDFHIAAPDAAQVQSIANNEAVKSIFPYYAYKKAFGNSNEIMLMASDEMDKIGSSIFSDAMCVEGAFSEDGAMLDKTAADILGVKVGDTISFTLLGKRVTKTVSAIYLPSTFAIMEKGIVAVSLSADMTKPAAYGGAFIVTNDRNAVAELLSDYVGEGNVALTYDQYVAIQCGDKKPNQSDAEYEAECRQKYADYRNGILESAKRGGGQVTDKLEAYSLLKEQILTTEKNTKTLMLLAAIAAFAAFVIVGSLAVITNVENDRIRRDDGMDGWNMLKGYAASSALTAVFVAAMTGLIVFLIASGTYFASECGFIVASTALPVLAGIPVVVVIAFTYVKNLYKNQVAAAKSAAAVEAGDAEPKKKPESSKSRKRSDEAERSEATGSAQNKIDEENQTVSEAKAGVAPINPEATQHEKGKFLDTVEQEIEEEKAPLEAEESQAKYEPQVVEAPVEKAIPEAKPSKASKLDIPGLNDTPINQKIEEADRQVDEQIREKDAKEQARPNTAEDQSAE